MTRTSEGGEWPAELVGAFGADLHRLGAVLLANTGRATGLVALTLAEEARGAEASSGTVSTYARLRRSLVRRYLRTVPRRAEGVLPAGGDAADVLRRLSPRARAASTLLLVEHMGAEEVAAALGVSVGKVGKLVPGTPGLEVALGALAGPACVGRSRFGAGP